MSRPIPALLTLTIALTMAMPSFASARALAEDPGHDHPAHEHAHHTDGVARDSPVMGPADGGLWPTDAPLRTGMARVHKALVQAHAAQDGAGLDRAGAAALAGEVRAAVAYMVANCQLEPAADADLHLLIGQMLAAVERAEQAPGDPAGVPALHATVEAYGAHFDHPGLHDEAH
jgi:hypothetical protein